MTEEPIDSNQPLPLWKRAMFVVVGLLAVVGLAFVAVHVMILPVSPDQEKPAGHFGRPCVACHIVTEGTDVIDVGN